MTWEPFDSGWLVRLASEQLVGEPSIADALSRVDRCFKKSVAYWYFVDPSDPNKPGSEWQFAENVMLKSPEYGPLVLDVLKDGRIGGVEFLNRINEVD